MTDRPRHLTPVPDDDPPGPPNDLAAERALLGAMLLSRTAIDDALEHVTGPEFHRPAHEIIWDAVTTLHLAGEPADPVTVGDHLTTTGQLTRAGGRAYLHDLVAAVPTTSNAAYYADIIAELAARRRLITIGSQIQQLGYTQNGADVTQLWDAAAHHIETGARYLPTQPHQDVPGLGIDDFLAGDDPEYDWLIPGLLERQDRLIITAGEGKGKSTLCRQLGIQTAAGIHPFTGERITPIKTLILDLENSRRQSRRKLRPLRVQAGKELDGTRLVIECRTGGIDLTTADDRAWLRTLVNHHRPDLLITGPIYKMASGDTDKEKDSKPVALALDALRDEFDMAVILEAHTRKAESNDPRKRPKEPFGWSGWMRWPEFGLHLSDDGELTHWRGARDERSWPHALTRGGTWPWTPAMSLAARNWITVRQAIRAAGRKLTVREIEDATGISKSLVGRILQDHSGELATLYYELEMEA